MATINGTSGNDTLTNLTSNDDFFGFAGNDVYEYNIGDGDDTITDSAGSDEIAFGAGINRYLMSLRRDGNDLILSTDESGTIRLTNHFASSSSRVETIDFDSDPSIDLTIANAYYVEMGTPSTSYYADIYTTNSNSVVYGSITEAEYEEMMSVGGGVNSYYTFTIISGTGDDLIYGNHAGIDGGSGNDTIYADEAVIYGSDGNDSIHGNNWLSGGGGNDLFYINNNPTIGGRAIAWGGDGSDTFFNDGYDALVYGDHGDDAFYGSINGASYYGGYGNDILYGGDGDEFLSGDAQLIDVYEYDGAGDDFIDGGNGNDNIVTGSGNDIAYGGNGNDTINAYYAPSYMGTGPNLIASGTNELYGEDGDDYILGGSGDDTIVGGNGDDLIYDVPGGNNVITGNDGNDQIYIYAGGNSVSGGNGNDTIGVQTPQGNIATIYGDTGDDLISFTGDGVAWGTQYVYGGDGNDEYDTRYLGGSDFGNITVFDQSGSADYLRIGSAITTDLTFAVSGNNLTISHPYVVGSLTITDMFVAAHRIENLEFTNKTGSLFETLSNNINSYSATASTSKLGIIHNFIEALGGNDTINANDGNDVVWGGTGGDTLNGNADNDILYGEDDDDTLRGGTGDDILDGGNNTDTASYSDATSAVTVSLAITTGQAVGGGLGTDTLTNIEFLRGSNYADTLTGDANGNSIWGANGNDTIYGGNGNDTLYGDGNNDTLYGEDGDDILFGGNNNDTLNGGNGTDTASYANATASITVSLAVATAQVTGEGTDTLSNIENLTGSNQADTLTGNTGSNVLNGLGGNDTLNGGDGIDLLVGGDGNDILNGGNGNDILHGNQGADDLYGNAGSDTFMFDYGTVTSGGIDEIKDFTAGVGGDVINIANVLSGFGYDALTDALTDWLQLTTSGSDTVFKLDATGTGSFGSATSILEVDGTTSLVLANLVTDGNLIT